MLTCTSHSIPSPSIPSLSMEYQCSNCGKTVSKSANTCPYCKIRFDYVEEADGSRSYSSGSSWSGSSFRGMTKLVIWGVIILFGVVTSVVGFIIKVCSGNSRKNDDLY